MKAEPIRIGDRFKTRSGTWEVIEKYPGGRLSLFEPRLVRFQERYVREVRTWERASPNEVKP
mgnify:CR=1 FL=1